MNIIGTQYTLQTKAFEIYVAGCSGSPHCSNCHNPESWDFNIGIEYSNEYFKLIKTKVNEFDSLIDNIMIFGGEPLDNNLDDLYQLLIDLDGIEKPIWLFTRYEISEIPEFIKKFCAYIKCGKYIPELTTEDSVQYGIKLATSNQKIYKKGKDY